MPFLGFQRAFRRAAFPASRLSDESPALLQQTSLLFSLDQITRGVIMTLSEDEDEHLAQFLESEVLSEISDQEDAKSEKEDVWPMMGLRVEQSCGVSSRGMIPMRIEDGFFSVVPPELFPHILKFLSSEDLVACSLVCRFLNFPSSDESQWRRLYCM